MEICHYLKPCTLLIGELISFVIHQNYLHHGEHKMLNDLEDLNAALCAEEQHYVPSHIFLAVSKGEMCGSIRIFKKKPFQQLPMEKLYPIALQKVAGENEAVYHIGRFAIRKGIDQNGFRIFKTLMVQALNIATQDQGGVVLAECDSKLLRTLRLLGIEAEAIGVPIFYMGSETIPIRLPWAGYQDFLKKNKSLLQHEGRPVGKEFPFIKISP